jgi:glycosyltransferase involved in cell wall biosynthesis
MLVSVVMAVYNGEEYLEEAIDSILGQTYANIELIIVNDASTDGTKDILEKIEDKRVKARHLATNRGAAYALNLAIDDAKGEWIAIHDADDISHPRRIEYQMQYLADHPNLVAVGSWIECIPGRKNPMVKNELEKFQNTMNSFQSRKSLRTLLYNCIPLMHGTVTFSKEAFLAAGRYHPNIKIAFDYDLWTRLVTVGDIENVPRKLYKYRRHHESISNKGRINLNKEMFSSFATYVRKTCFKRMKIRPAVIVFGTTAGVESFALHTKNNLKVADRVDKRPRAYLPAIKAALEQKKIDGIVILSNFKGKQYLIKYFKSLGLKRNKNLFVFHCWLQ